MRNTCQEEIYNLAAKNKKVIFIGSDLGAGVQDNLKKLSKSIYYGRCFRTTFDRFCNRFG